MKLCALGKSCSHPIWLSRAMGAFVAAMVVWASTNTALAQEGDVEHIHDPAIIKEDKTYYIFGTGPGIRVWKSDDLITWKRAGKVFDEMPAWVAEAVPGAKDIWAPDISYFNGRYHLYYSVSLFGKNISAIGLATNKTLNRNSDAYRWEDHGIVIQSQPGRDNWNAIDPNLVLDEKGQPWLAFGSFWSGLKMIRIDRNTGKRVEGDGTLHHLAGRHGGAIEAPFLIERNGWWYLFVSFDQCCQGARSTYRTMVGRSKSLTGPYVDRSGRKMTDGAATSLLEGYDHVRGPGHNSIFSEDGVDYLVHHFYDANNDGRRTLQIRPLVWADDGWPLPGEPITKESLAHKTTATSKLDGDTRWRHSANFQPAGEITLLADGTIGGAEGATWSLEGRKLTMRWPSAAAPGGVWIDECILAADGGSYVGRNQADVVVRGALVK